MRERQRAGGAKELRAQQALEERHEEGGGGRACEVRGEWDVHVR